MLAITALVKGLKIRERAALPCSEYDDIAANYFKDVRKNDQCILDLTFADLRIGDHTSLRCREGYAFISGAWSVDDRLCRLANTDKVSGLNGFSGTISRRRFLPRCPISLIRSYRDDAALTSLITCTDSPMQDRHYGETAGIKLFRRLPDQPVTVALPSQKRTPPQAVRR